MKEFFKNQKFSVFDFISFISFFFSLLIFIGTLFYSTLVAQLICLMMTVGFGIVTIISRNRLSFFSRVYITITPPTMFGITILMVGGYFGQGVGIATSTFLSFIILRSYPKARVIVICYDILMFVLPTIYITLYEPIFGYYNLPFDEIIVFLIALGWLFLTFLLYDASKMRKHTDAIEIKNNSLLQNKKELQTAHEELLFRNTKLSSLNNELRLKNKQIEEFIFVLTHDLKTPLNNIHSIINELQKQNLDTNENTELFFKHLNGNTFRMSKLIHSLMEYAKIGNMGNLQSTDCNAILNEVLEDISQQISNTKTKITIGKMPTNLVCVEQEIRLLFQNLIGNAVKFSSQNNQPELDISHILNETHHLFKIKDNGIGIAPEEQENIFNAFHRVHTHKQFEGSGIGLYGCKKIIDHHEGKIWVESVENKGSTFYFSISKNLS